jgi:hypothetical protein
VSHTCDGYCIAAALDKAQAALDVIKNMLKTMGPDVLPVLRTTWRVPQATFHALKAVLHVLGKKPDTFSNWKRANSHFTGMLFLEISSYDATKVRAELLGAAA